MKFVGIFCGLKLYSDPTLPRSEARLLDPKTQEIVLRFIGLPPEPKERLTELALHSFYNRMNRMVVDPKTETDLMAELSSYLIPHTTPEALPYEDDGDYD